jgi:hypothetical protein
MCTFLANYQYQQPAEEEENTNNERSKNGTRQNSENETRSCLGEKDAGQHREFTKGLAVDFANEEKLRSKYPNKFIAVKGKKVLFTNEEFKELFATIKAEGKDIDDFTIEYINEKPACLLL